MAEGAGSNQERDSEAGETAVNEETLFHEALAKPLAELAAFLDLACAGQPELGAAVEALLAANEAAGSFLEKVPAATGDCVPSHLGVDAIRLNRHLLHRRPSIAH